MKHDEILSILAPAALEVDSYLARFKKRPRLVVHSFSPRFENRLYGGGKDEVKVDFESITFNLADIESKWGFRDGDILNGFFFDWSTARGWREGEENIGYPYTNAHDLLWECWLKFLQPKSGIRKRDVFYMSTVHNPIRTDVGWGAFDGAVEVRVDDLIKLADSLFTPKSGSWLRTYCCISEYDVRKGLGDKVPRKIATILEPALLQLPEEAVTVYFDLISNKREVSDKIISFTDCAILTAGAVSS